MHLRFRSYRWIGGALLLAFVGCTTTSDLMVGQKGTYDWSGVDNGLKGIPMALSINAPDLIPATKGEMEQVVSGFTNMGKVKRYPLASVARDAFQDCIDVNFRLPRADEIPKFKINVLIQKSQLALQRHTASYRVTSLISVTDEYGKSVFEKTLEGTASSPFDGIHVPEAVWRGNYGVASRLVSEMRNDRMLYARLKKLGGGLGVGNTYECDLHVLDLNSRREIGVSGRALNKDKLRELARELVGKLSDKWVPKGLPKVAVLDFSATGVDANQKLGATFASFVETSLGELDICELVDRKRLGEIMQEHDIIVSDIARDPNKLQDVNLGLDKVQYFVTGNIAVLSSE